MKCWICHKEMENTIGGCYYCRDCGVGVDDLVFRTPIKDKENNKTAESINELQEPKPTIIDSTELGTLGAYFEADTAQKKIKELKQQLVEKDKEIEQLKDNQNQKTIECLKEVREKIFGTSETGIVFDIPNIQDAYYAIDNKIKELEGE